MLPLGHFRREMSIRKHDVPPDRVGDGADRLGRFRSLGAGVQAHVRKIGAEARLEELTQPYIEWTAGPTQRLFDCGRRLFPAISAPSRLVWSFSSSAAHSAQTRLMRGREKVAVYPCSGAGMRMT
jgi:hypothetical protein